MPRAWIATAFVGLLAAAPAAHASLRTILRGDAEAWKAAARLDARFGEGEEEEMAWQADDELFPETAGGQASSPGPATRQREERTTGLVTALIGGRTVAFRDVPEDAWFAPYVRGALEAGIVSGYRDAAGNPTGEYRPERGVSVEELAKIAVNATGGITRSCEAPPRNATASGSWSAAFVGCAERNGWSVYADGAVDVKKPATRAQVVATLLQAFAVGWGERTGTVFTDVGPTTEFGAAIERAKADGLVTGYADAEGKPTGKFGPGDPVTRAEIAKMTMNALGLYGR